MSRFRMTRRRLAVVVPAAAVLATGAGVAVAATTGHESENDHATYTSSVTTPAQSDNGNEAAQDLALAKLAKISLGQAAESGAKAVDGGVATGVKLENEGGNVVYVVDVVTGQDEYEVVLDAGNGNVLAKQAESADEHGDHADEHGDHEDDNAGTSNPAGGSTSEAPASAGASTQP
ncbi:MAG: PepSY domain-containing protein [Actinomycetes bacterium]